jgi:ABC-type xylose transport system permease subunit
MSREERRQYERMMKNMDRAPGLPPAARARAERNAARRAKRQQPERQGAFSRRFWVRSLIAALVIGFLGFSLQWENGMPFALYVGVAVGLVVLAVIVGFRFLQRRVPAP